MINGSCRQPVREVQAALECAKEWAKRARLTGHRDSRAPASGSPFISSFRVPTTYESGTGAAAASRTSRATAEKLWNLGSRAERGRRTSCEREPAGCHHRVCWRWRCSCSCSVLPPSGGHSGRRTAIRPISASGRWVHGRLAFIHAVAGLHVLGVQWH